jgi:hypothetical protein
MLDTDTKRRIDTARDILVGKVPDPKSQVEQITIALIYKFMDDMDAESEELGGKRKFFTGEFARYGWARLMDRRLGGHEMLGLYGEGIAKMPENPGIPPLFRDIFKNAYLPYRDPETLKAFLKIIDEFSYDHSERLGDAFEYLLSVLGSQGDAGQFRTPRHIIDFMVEVLDPQKHETILDPACGTAGFLISAYKHIQRKHDQTDRSDRSDRSDPADVPPNGPYGLLLVFGMGLASSVCAFRGKRIAAINLALVVLILALVFSIFGPGHWIIWGIYIFDISTITLLILAMWLLFKQSRTRIPASQPAIRATGKARSLSIAQFPAAAVAHPPQVGHLSRIPLSNIRGVDDDQRAHPYPLGPLLCYAAENRIRQSLAKEIATEPLLGLLQRQGLINPATNATELNVLRCL